MHFASNLRYANGENLAQTSPWRRKGANLAIMEIRELPANAAGGPSQPFNGALWGIDEIAEFLNKGHSTARKYAADPSFPLPIMGAQRDRRWFPDEVIAHFRTSRQPIPEPQLQIPTQLIPHRITTKAKKVKAA